MSQIGKIGRCEDCGGANYVGHPCRESRGFLSAKAEAKLAEVIDASQELEVRGEQPEATMAPTNAREFEIARLAVRSNEYLEVFWGAMPIRQFELYEREKAETFVSAFNLKLNIQSRLSSEAIESASKEAAQELVYSVRGWGTRSPAFMVTMRDRWSAIIRAAIEKVRSNGK